MTKPVFVLFVVLIFWILDILKCCGVMGLLAGEITAEKHKQAENLFVTFHCYCSRKEVISLVLACFVSKVNLCYSIAFGN